MNQKWKKVSAVVMAMGMAASGSAVSYASAPSAPSAGTVETETLEIDATSGSDTTSELTGYIAISSIKVVVPVKAGFDIDPNASTDLNTGHGRIKTQASNYTITNNSELNVAVKISSVTANGVTLTRTESDALDKSQHLMLAVRKKGVATKPSVSTANDWMLTGANAMDSYNLDAGASECTVTGGGSLEMELFGITKTGWTGNDEKFTVTPTFTIRLANN